MGDKLVVDDVKDFMSLDFGGETSIYGTVVRIASRGIFPEGVDVLKVEPSWWDAEKAQKVIGFKILTVMEDTNPDRKQGQFMEFIGKWWKKAPEQIIFMARRSRTVDPIEESERRSPVNGQSNSTDQN